jgi:hypothetical protein
MNRVELRADGHLAAKAAIIADDPLAYLGCQLELEPGASLRSVFRMLERYPLLARLSAFLGDLLTQYRKCPQQGCRCADIDHLEFGKTIEMIGYPGDPRLEIYLSLSGRSGGDTIDIRPYALESLLDMEIRLGILKHVIFGDRVDTFQFDTVFNLFEFIDGVAWELSFHDMPKECQLRR